MVVSYYSKIDTVVELSFYFQTFKLIFSNIIANKPKAKILKNICKQFQVFLFFLILKLLIHIYVI